MHLVGFYSTYTLISSAKFTNLRATRKYFVEVIIAGESYQCFRPKRQSSYVFVIELVTNMKTSESPFTAGHDFIHIILDVSIPKFSSLKLSPASPAATSRESTQNNFKI